MNPAASPKPLHRKRLARHQSKDYSYWIFLWLGWLFMGACVEVNGGAAELAWSLRSFAGDPVSNACQATGIDKIRLCWNSVEGGSTGCRPGNFRDFDCGRGNGSTLFEIPTGPTEIFAKPICKNGEQPMEGRYQSPAPIVREVREGEIVTLNALLIVVRDPNTCGTECTCPES